MIQKSYLLKQAEARKAWLHAQRLDQETPFGAGPEATRLAIEHLGYVQIDTINVIERSHHHILHTRIPAYDRAHLEQAQTTDKSVFEYWTHALAYLPTADYRFFARAMNRFRSAPAAWFTRVDQEGYAALLRRIRTMGALCLRDIDDEVLVEKTHPWGSRKPSSSALRLGFFSGDLTVSKRAGVTKTYELANRHFAWKRRPRPATDIQYGDYLLRRAIRSQGVVSLDSICYGDLKLKPQIAELIAAKVTRRKLIAVVIENHEKIQHWAEPAILDDRATLPGPPLVHILSPFDPLVIQRKRLKMHFGYEHRFEAYIPPEQRVLGYFALPILIGDRIVAAIDMKTDRHARKLLIRKWTWTGKESPALKAAIEDTLHRFERFQLA